jgi:hypothetical protein
MEAQEKLSPEESLQLIQSMINKTKTNAAEDAFNFLVWGWITFIICIAQYILKVIVKYQQHYLAWSLIWVAVIIVIVKSIIDRKKVKKVVTYVDDSMKYLWTGVGISFFVLGWICAVNQWQNCFPLFIMLYGVGTFVSGCLLKFKPFVIGGILCWIIAPIAAYVKNYDYQILLTALALLISYIIPGHLLKSRYKKQTN